MIDPIIVFRLYMATKLHFTTEKYDIHKSLARVGNINQTTFNKNIPRKRMLERTARKFNKIPDVVEFFVSQYAYGDASSAFDPQQAEDNYERWMKNKISMTQLIIDDLYGKDINQFIMGNSPPILSEVAGGRCHIESAVALNRLKPWVGTDYFVFNDLALKIKKLERFVQFNQRKVETELWLHETEASI
jgi:hypothetical protein